MKKENFPLSSLHQHLNTSFIPTDIQMLLLDFLQCFCSFLTGVFAIL